jgi:hypothetical protein
MYDMTMIYRWVLVKASFEAASAMVAYVTRG